MIEAVIFDIDGVLIDSNAAEVKFMQDLLNGFGYKKPSKKEVLEVLSMTSYDKIKLLSKERDPSKVETMLKYARKMPFPSKLEKAEKNAEQVIMNLSSSYKLAIVTNRMRIGIADLFRILNVKRYFTTVVSFEDFSKPKPSPEPLLIAMHRLAVNKSAAVYVGDSDTDEQSAKSAGMHFIRCGKNHHDKNKLFAKDLSQIPSLINRLNNS